MPKRNTYSHYTSLRRVVVLFVVLASLWLLPQLSSAEEGWSLEAGGALIYTDDAGLYSATRRLGREADPTLPAIDVKLTDQGSDVVFVPVVDITRSLTNNLGQLDLNVEGEGLIFTENPEFTHGTLRLQATQALSSTTRLQARFIYAPNQFLGNNEERQSGQELVMAEKLTSYIWSTRLSHDVTPDLSVHLLGRYGLRRYNEAFSERNMDFWTIGPHVEWRVAPKIKLGLSYHYERGLAEGRTQPQFEDDTSYVNHYLSGDVDVELTERLSLFTAVHFEHNIWTSGLVGDERNGAHENIYAGELALAYRLTDSIQGFGLVQRSSRKESFESSAFENTAVGIGLSAKF